MIKNRSAATWLVIVLALAFSSHASAQSIGVTVEDGWARATIGTSRPGSIYMQIRNDRRTPVTLTEIRSELARSVQLHQTSVDAQGVASMSSAGGLVINPGEAASFEPGGLHVMLMGLRHAMVEGAAVEITLAFSDGTEMLTTVPVLGIAAQGPAP